MKTCARLVILLLIVWLSLWRLLAQPQPPAIRAAPAPLAQELLANFEIAPLAEALTFARYAKQGQIHLLRVERYRDGKVMGLDLEGLLSTETRDPVSAFHAMGYEQLSSLHGDRIEVPADSLLLPFDGTDSQIAAGVNYPEHGKEVQVRESFLFPKQVRATAFNAQVPARDHLLDYEVELGFVALEPIRRDTAPQYLGLVLASDYTDRAALMRHMRLTDVSSGEGFTQGKSQAGSMPIGNLLVIPRDYERFYRNLQLQLWHNGHLRQDARPGEMTWDVQRILQESFAREGRHWTWNGVPVALPVAQATIPARTLILSGTPGGVIFEPPTTRQLFLGLSEWLFTLKWAHPQHVIEPFLRESYASGRYLQPGDSVVMRAERLGLIQNTVSP